MGQHLQMNPIRFGIVIRGKVLCGTGMGHLALVLLHCSQVHSPLVPSPQLASTLDYLMSTLLVLLDVLAARITANSRWHHAEDLLQ